eukprot:Lithocolla_globosa_v1_NODE_3484_length_1658_cov_15.344978.p4 type:complete len:106 gc:universal NODE_3484_length_1658_cov_15.344978:528-211(-)
MFVSFFFVMRMVGSLMQSMRNPMYSFICSKDREDFLKFTLQPRSSRRTTKQCTVCEFFSWFMRRKSSTYPLTRLPSLLQCVRTTLTTLLNAQGEAERPNGRQRNS